MSKENLNEIPVKRAFFLIFLVTLLISGTAWTAFFSYSYFFKVRSRDKKYQIIALVQTGPAREILKTAVLAEILDLSVDKPTNLYAFNIEKGRQKLLAFPLIKEALIRRIAPGTLYVDYTTRKPIAFLGDFSNTALDEEGILFPFSPFFTPKNLPEIYLGLQSDVEKIWGKKLEGKKATLGFKLLKTFTASGFFEGTRLIRLDLSHCFESSEGNRQIIVLLEDKYLKDGENLFIEQHLLRLGTKNYEQGLKNYLALRDFLREKKDLGNEIKVIDLRISKLGFIKNLKKEEL